jgi:hypothetical protein
LSFRHSQLIVSLRLLTLYSSFSSVSATRVEQACQTLLTLTHREPQEVPEWQMLYLVSLRRIRLS